MKVTEAAVAKFQEILAEKENPNGTMLRIYFAGFG